jgi:polysaccharide export outer membrane protein
MTKGQHSLGRKTLGVGKFRKEELVERMGTLFLGFLVLLTAVPRSLWGQTSAVPSPEVSSSGTSSTAENSNSDQPTLQKRNPRYRVHADDVLALTFPLSPEFDQPNVAVQPDGYINLQGVDSVYVQGLSAPEIVEVLKKAYAGTLHDPIISVDLVDVQKPYFLASGQVGKPGQYDLRHETTVSEGIAIAGGLVPTAKTQVFLFHRVSTNWVEVKKLNLNDLLRGKNANEDAYLAPGDSIFVPEKFITKFRKYIPYGIGTSISPAFY